ncbi:hypothetical protein DDT54_22185 [Brenneria nigrifluens DSM 30175 = ATCC 13028]|uniref:Uncharacterized protein n=1 Tax=Brenneria nigrifluens DSM 30175 = ATCC 13028 TaxID=1121120 RepID=A0A2U1UCG0_9GAMM|nr:hypothetical protein DDT54_22185 [Brenneria nigrifluens DSM 30175 = ATCC 13028]
MAHILLSRTYKSNNFSQLRFVCAIPAQDEQIHNKKRILSTKKQMLILLVKKIIKEDKACRATCGRVKRGK